MTKPHVLKFEAAHGVVFAGKAFVLKHRSSSRYHLNFPGGTIRFCCQDGCCDAGLQPDVRTLVEAAKLLGATEVVLRTGLRGYYVSEIAGLPVRDVSDHVGPVCDGVSIGRG